LLIGDEDFDISYVFYIQYVFEANFLFYNCKFVVVIIIAFVFDSYNPNYVKKYWSNW